MQTTSDACNLKPISKGVQSKQGQDMKISSASKITITVVLITSIISLSLLAVNKFYLIQENAAQHQLNTAHQLMAQFIEGREDLTQAMRGFAATGKPRFQQRYQQEIAVDRHIENAKLGFSKLQLEPEALQLIDAASHLSEALSQIDHYIMQEAGTGQYRLATVLAFDESYHELLVLFHGFVENAHQKIISSHQDRLQSGIQQRQVIDVLALVALLVNLAMVLLALIYFFQRRVVRPLVQLTESAQHMLSSDQETPLLARNGAQEFNDLLGVLEQFRLSNRDKQLEIRLNEERLHQFVDAAPNGMLKVDKSGAILMVNHQVERLFGYSRGEMLGNKIEMLLPERLRAAHPGQRDGFMHDPQPRAMGVGRDLFGRRKDGGEFPVEIGLNPINTPEGLQVIASIIDISERKKAEAIQRQLNDELEQRNLDLNKLAKHKSEFLANMSHEIRTPMNAIVGMTYLAQQSLGAQQRAGDSTLSNYLAKISQASNQLLSIINDILDSSKIEAGKLEIESIEFSLESVFEQVGDILSLKADDKGLELLFDIEPSLPPVLLGDPLRLGQILLNLGSNAVKFTEAGQITLGVTRSHNAESSSPEQIELQFSVKDSGIGMTEEQCANLFQSFSQADSSITRKFGGTGLGLSIAKSLVELMGGAISVQSNPGVGSEFRFNAWFGRLDSKPSAQRDELLGEMRRTILNHTGVLIKPVNPSSLFNALTTGLLGRAVATETAQIHQQLTGQRVLLVEDNELNQELAAALLRQVGVLVTVAGDGRQALQALTDGPGFDAVLMDCHMPVMDGYQATLEIRRNPAWADLPIVALTADAMKGTKEQVLTAGMNDYLTKPLDVALLYATLSRWTGEGKKPAPKKAASKPALKPGVSTAPGLESSTPELPGIDTAAGLRVCAGNAALYQQLLQMFAQAQADFGARFADALRDADPQAAQRCAHSLKGSAGNIGAQVVAAAAAELEQACREGAEPEKRSLLCDSVLRALAVVQAGLAELAQQGQASDEPE